MNKEQIENEINFITRELKECDNDNRYESLWNKRIELKEQLEKLK